VDAVHSFTHPRCTTVACFAGITPVGKIQRFLPVLTSAFRDPVSSNIIRIGRNPTALPFVIEEVSEDRHLVRYERTIGTSVLPTIPYFIYHRLQNYQLNTGLVL
jgi:hypothetical protein